MAVVRLTEHLAMTAPSDGAADVEGFHTGIAQFVDILADAFSVSGAARTKARFGIDVDTAGAVITPAGEGVIDVTVTWDGGELLMDFDDMHDIDDIDDLEIEPTFDFDDDTED